MRIICLVKFIPDVDNFIYDAEKNVLIRENVKMILNPDDACAVAFALRIKAKDPATVIEVVTMAPTNVIPHLEDLLRRYVDHATLISDKSYGGSDTYVTSKILAKYLFGQTFDCILTGTHALDGDTSHIPAQVGEILSMCQMSNIIKIDEDLHLGNYAMVEVDSERMVSTYEIELPAILSLQKESKYKLPHVKYKNLNLDVSHQLSVISNCELAFNTDEVGIEGSLTKVSRTYVRNFEKKDRLIVSNDAEGIEVVYTFLKDKGFV